MADELETQTVPADAGDNLSNDPDPSAPSDAATGGQPPKPQSDSDWYWKRQAEKDRKERETLATKLSEAEAKAKALEDEKLTEQERKAKEAEESKAEAEKLRRENARLQAIMEAELPPELAALVPEGTDDPKSFIEERVLPLKEKMTSPGGFGQPNNPPPVAVGAEDQRIYNEYMRLKRAGKSERLITQYYEQNRDVLMRMLAGRRG